MKNLIGVGFSKKQMLFFIDRDLSKPRSLQNDYNVYITDNYWMKNDIVNVRTLHGLFVEN